MLSLPCRKAHQPLEPVGDLRGNQIQIDAAALLEVRELRDLQSVEHHLPADAPRAERRRLPVVFFELDVVLAEIDADRLEACRYRSRMSSGEGFRIT